MAEDMAEPLEDLDELAERLSGKLSDSVRLFVLSGNTGTQPWFEMMVRTLKRDLTLYLQEDYNHYLIERGMLPLSAERITMLVLEVLGGTDDLRTTVLTAPGSITAGGRFTLNTVVGRVHQLGIVKSLIRVLQGRASELSGRSGDGFTGRRRWRTSVASSRHTELNFVEAGPDDMWEVAPGVRWQYPREDPTMAASASGCRCFVEYQYIVNGREVWL